MLTLSVIGVEDGAIIAAAPTGERYRLPVDDALRVFWTHGYPDTSLERLTAATGLGKGSLYSTFGSKDGLFVRALERYAEQHNVKWEKVTQCALEGEGRIGERVQRRYEALTGNKSWMADLKAADVVFVATHSQGSVVSTHLLARLLAEGHILTQTNMDILARTAAAVAPGASAGSAGCWQAAKANAETAATTNFMAIPLGVITSP